MSTLETLWYHIIKTVILILEYHLLRRLGRNSPEYGNIKYFTSAGWFGCFTAYHLLMGW